MAHAKPEHLKSFAVLLDEFRKQSALKEKSFGCFYRKSKSVLHFHVKAERLFAHVYDGQDWKEVDLVAPMVKSEQKQLSQRILTLLQDCK